MLAVPAAAAAQDRHLQSPNGAIDVTIGQDPTTKGPTYAIAFHGRPVIETSPLGLAFEGYKKLGLDTAVTGAARTSVDTRYRLRPGCRLGNATICRARPISVSSTAAAAAAG